MTRDQSKALADLLAGLPDAVDYDAVHAALVATTGGRRFVEELTRRNRNTDTQMVLGAMARVEAAIRGDPAPKIPAIVTRELTEIAAAIDRLAAGLAVAKTPATSVIAALERIQDVAFVLHERPVEDSLCDALDAAVREISDVVAAAEEKPPGAPVAAELLRALAHRVSMMIALALEADDADLPSVPAESEAASGRPLDRLQSHEEAVTQVRTVPPGPSAVHPVERDDLAEVADQEELAALRGLSEEELIALFS